jgi:ABC-type transport system involved in multi-copper enzyme maturation permease subunit
MLPGPVFNLELRRLSRRRRYYALLTLYGLVLLYVVWSNNPQEMFVVPAGPAGGLSVDQWHYAGKSLFGTYAIWQMAMVVLLTPAMVAGVIAEERDRKTMPSLLMTGLTSGEIVLGKLCARLFHLGCFVALGMPILVLVERFGGVGMKGVLFTFAATATSAFFFGAASILVSTQARRPRDAIVCVYLLEFAWHIAPALVLVFLSSNLFAPLRKVAEWVGSTCPLLVMIGGVRGVRFWESSNLDDLVWMMALQLALGAVMTTVAVRRLRPAFLKDESKQQYARAGERDEAKPENNTSQPKPRHTEPQPVRSWLNATSNDNATPEVELAPPEPGQTESQPTQFWRRPACGNDAMIWKEVWSRPKSRMTRVLRWLVLATMLTLAAFFCFSQGLESAEELFENGYSAEYEDLYHRLELNVRLRYLVTLTAGFMLLWVSIAAACSLAGERDGDTWLSLVSTPLTGFEIIRGKVIGACWSVRWLLAVWLALVILGLFVGAVHPLGALAVTLATATYLAFGCVLGMVYSLRARTSSRAVVWTLFTLVILSGAYLLVFIPWNMRSELTLVGVTPFVEEVVLMSYLDAKWLLDFESPEKRLLDIALTCLLSVALYAGGTFVLAIWTLKSFDRVIDRPGSTTASARRPPKAVPLSPFRI